MVATTQQHRPQVAVMAVLQPSADPSLQSSMRGCVTLPAAQALCRAGGLRVTAHTQPLAQEAAEVTVLPGEASCRRVWRCGRRQVRWFLGRMTRAAARTCAWPPTHSTATQNNGQAAARPCSRAPPPPGRTRGGGRARRARAGLLLARRWVAGWLGGRHAELRVARWMQGRGGAVRARVGRACRLPPVQEGAPSPSLPPSLTRPLYTTPAHPSRPRPLEPLETAASWTKPRSSSTRRVRMCARSHSSAEWRKEGTRLCALFGGTPWGPATFTRTIVDEAKLCLPPLLSCLLARSLKPPTPHPPCA